MVEKRRVCFLCGKEISWSEAVPIYKEVLDRETGELKRVVDYFLCKSCVTPSLRSVQTIPD